MVPKSKGARILAFGPMNVQYSEVVDAIIYSRLTQNFTHKDWLTLAEAAKDQEGIEERLVVEMIRTDKRKREAIEDDS